MIGSIGQKARNLTRWVGEQVVGDDYGYGDERQRDYAVIGATAGAVVGATVGTNMGFSSQASNDINEVWENRTIDHPEMNGYSHYTTPVFGQDCTTNYEGETSCTTTIEGWWHHYSPNISNRVVGNYTEPTFQNSNFLEPLMGGFLGALGGGVVGLAAGIGAAALQNSLEEKAGKSSENVRLEPEVKTKLTERSGATVLATTAIGAGIGAYLGTQAGTIELGAQEVHNRTWAIPVTESEVLGYKPASHYEWNWSGFPLPLGGSRAATQPVSRQVPVYGRDGEPRMQDTTKTFETNRYGPIFGGIVGGALGAGVGLAAGVAIGVGDKLLTEHKARQESAA